MMSIKTKSCFRFMAIVIVVMVCCRFYPYSYSSVNNEYDVNQRVHWNNSSLIKCDRNSNNSKRKKASGGLGTQLVTIPEFYEKQSKCTHRFKDKIAFFHLGKAGGGTVNRELRKNHIGISMSHPYPKKSRIQDLQKNMTTLIINVRDPVDRFVSAFRWRLAVLCHPDDNRAVSSEGGGATSNPHDKCKTSKSEAEEERMLRETYRSDPSVIAEALCEGSPSHEKAIEDYSLIGHSMTLAEWLEFLIEPDMLDEITDDGIQNFIALPLEKQGDNEALFESHIQQLSLHLLQTRYDKETASRIIKQKPQDDESKGKGKEKWEHSSAKFHNSTNSTVPVTLSPLGECCLTRHLQQDYRLIQTMLGDSKKEMMSVQPIMNAHPAIKKACSWGSEEQQKLCRSDLRSMLLRRARYLDVSMGTCPTVISSN